VTRARDLGASLMDALQGGGVAPAVWADCVDRLLPALDAARASSLVDGVLLAELAFIRAPEIEADPALRARLAALHRIAVHREPGVPTGPEVRDAVSRELEALRGAGALGPVARDAADGPSGTDGTDGAPGPDGPEGAPGRVSIELRTSPAVE
jgi:hypothetical protein